MLKFNNNHIFTGYLKQLLASFNLPMYRVYSLENYKYAERYGKESPDIICTIRDPKAGDESWPKNMQHVQYIKDDEVQEYVWDGQKYYWQAIDTYFVDKKRLNYTKNLRITNNIYDTYTHEYLGDYLRFLRDYYGLDLMPLYNCFTADLCSNLYTTFTPKEATGAVVFDAADKRYKIYRLPVKLFKKYTVAIDCNTSVEMCCGIYSKYLNTATGNLATIPQYTYFKTGQTKFNAPFLYDKLENLRTFVTPTSMIELANNESALCLFIKVPEQARSSIVVLEGDYRGWNDKIVRPAYTGSQSGSPNSVTKLEIYKNKTITNFETFDECYKICKTIGNGIISRKDFVKTRTFVPITELELLQLNTGEHHPFSDRLIEYLSGNTIDVLDDVSDNIVRTQQVVAENTAFKISDVLDTGAESGIWDERMRPILYSYMQNTIVTPKLSSVIGEDVTWVHSDKAGKNKQLLDGNHDCLGYVDKNVEMLYAHKSGRDSHSIAYIDIYPDLYKDLKSKEVH